MAKLRPCLKGSFVVIPTDPDQIGRVEGSLSTDIVEKDSAAKFTLSEVEGLGMTVFRQVLR